MHLVHQIWHPGKCFESVQEIETAIIVQLKTLRKEDFQTDQKVARRMGEIFGVRGNSLIEINGDISFTIRIF